MKGRGGGPGSPRPFGSRSALMASARPVVRTALPLSDWREHVLHGNLQSGRIEAELAVLRDSRLDQVARPALVMERHAVVGIENELMRDAHEREIARQLDAVIARRRSLRENF